MACSNMDFMKQVPLVGISLILSVQLLMSTTATEIIPPREPTSNHINHINGSNIINEPNRNSTTKLVNRPFVKIPSSVIGIGERCEHDADCGNYSVCLLKKVDDEETIKVCQCDLGEMKKFNNSCYIKPGHQCYYPDKNEHGYRYIQCFPGSECKTSMNKSALSNGYCMCHLPNFELHYRELDREFEMAHCGAPLLRFFNNQNSIQLLFTISILVIGSFICY